MYDKLEEKIKKLERKLRISNDRADVAEERLKHIHEPLKSMQITLVNAIDYTKKFTKS